VLAYRAKGATRVCDHAKVLRNTRAQRHDARAAAQQSRTRSTRARDCRHQRTRPQHRHSARARVAATSPYARHSALKTIIDATAKAQPRYSRSEIRIVRTVDVAALRKSADDAARQRRQPDAEIQQTDWTVDVMQ
jgi:hypothetical protein